jgi:hypothetical protein
MIVASGRVTAFAWPRQWLMRPTADDRARPRSCGDPAKPSRWQAWFNVRIAYGADLTPRTGLQNITFPSHADNFRHALLFHRAGPAPMISRPQRLRQTAADLEDKALQCEGIHCDDEQRSNGSPAPAVLTLAESEISQHHARSERNGDFTSPTSLVTRSKTLFGANSRLAAGQIPKCVGLDLPLRRISAIAAEDGGAQSPDCWLTPNTALSAPSSSPFAYKWKPELNERSFTLPARPKAPAAWQK